MSDQPEGNFLSLDTTARIAAPVCRQSGCGAQTWGSCTHCTEPYCADHLAPVGEFSELVCADDIAASRPSGDR